jgi:dTDP-4-amino-4,6-dideoxygalactose transaminase
MISLERKYLETDHNCSIKEYLQLEKEANKARYLDFSPKKMTEASRNILLHSKHSYSADRRRANYSYLFEKLQKLSGINIWGEALDQEEKYVPFGFMVIVNRRDEFYSFLAERGVIGEIQWVLPEQYYEPGEYAKFLSEHSLMLQCDQRYGIEAMEYTVEVIKEYFSKL